MNWIPITLDSKMPEHNELVLVFTKQGIVELFDLAWWDNEHQCWWDQERQTPNIRADFYDYWGRLVAPNLRQIAMSTMWAKVYGPGEEAETAPPA